MEAVRFLTVAVAGLALDLAVSWSAARLLGLPLWLAAAVGFCVAATINYLLHELWTFRGGERRLSVGRFIHYAMTLTATLGTRVATVAVLVAIFGEGKALLVLVAGSCVSFGVNFMMIKFLVFRPGSDLKDPTR